MSTSKVPVVGQKITTRAGKLATITKIHAAGTIDIRIDETGDYFRMSGLSFRKCGHCGGAYPMDQSCGCFDNDSQ